MRKSSRLLAKNTKDADPKPVKGAKRSRETASSVSEVDGTTAFTTTKRVRKRQKTEPKSPAKTSKPSIKDREHVLKVKDESTEKLEAVKKEASYTKSPSKSTKEINKNKMASSSSQGFKFIGAHVSIAGGLYKAVHNAVQIGAKAFAMFLRSQRQWNSKPLDDKTAELFIEACKSEGFAPSTILPHGIYLMNLGSPDDETLTKSRAVLVEELQRCEKLGLTLYNFHPGSTCGKITVQDCIERIGESINKAHAQTKKVVTVIENMSCQGHTIGGKFEELSDIIDLVRDKSRVGVCIDTCHAFAAGHDISTDKGYEEVMDNFDKIVGLKYLKAIHLNDSKGKLGCHLDRHENIGQGSLGKATFHRIMVDPRLNGIPMILETPCEADNTYMREIKMLYSMTE